MLHILCINSAESDEVMKYNISGCSHATAIFHFRLNSHFHDYSSGFKLSIFLCDKILKLISHCKRLLCASNGIYYMLMSYLPHIHILQERVHNMANFVIS